MRLLFTLLLLLLIVAIVGFLVTNPYTAVSVTVWTTTYPDVPLGYIVILSVIVGVVFASAFAIAEGLKIRLENRRLRRENQRLDSEITYLRTEARPSSPALNETAGEVAVAAGRGESRAPQAPPGAPVYESDPGDDGAEDDPYTGGRAV